MGQRKARRPKPTGEFGQSASRVDAHRAVARQSEPPKRPRSVVRIQREEGVVNPSDIYAASIFHQ